MTKNRVSELLWWKGVLADVGATLRRIAFGVLMLLSITYVCTQWGYVGVQFADGSSAYLVFLLVPVALAALLLGTLPGTCMGLFAGAVLYLHAAIVPLDYFEITYVRLGTTVVSMTVFGLVMGVLLSLVLHSGRTGVRRALLVSLVCLVSSWVYSVGFVAGTDIAATISFQTFGEALVLIVFLLAALWLAERGLRKAGGAGLRDIFGARLATVVFVALMVVTTAAYVTVTAGELAESTEDMRSEVEYVAGQVQREADYNGKVYAYLFDAGQGTQEQLEAVQENGILSNLLMGFSEDVDGIVIVSVYDLISGMDTDRFGSPERLSDLFDEDILAAVEKSIAEGMPERVVYLAPSKYSDLVDVALPGTEEAFASLVTPQVGYLMAAQSDVYRVIMIRPSSMVFAGRGDVVNWILVAALVLLVVVFLLVRWLLDDMVARRIDETNATLGRITDGDLKARVQPTGAHEFWDLAAGINVTVDALQGWIAEAESRMDAELATAKAIQESALPNVFPPYPDIQRFDIFASMNAAKEVGGDFYDFFLVGDDCGPDAGRLVFVMADVSGKGVPAALFMMKAKTQLRDYLESGMEVGEAVENTNRRLCDGNDAGMFVTAWIGVLDYATGHIEYVNAGHNPPLLWQDGAWQWVRQKSGLPLGLFDGLPYKQFAMDCEVGDQLLLYTDGVTEAFSVDEEQYGEKRLEALVNEEFVLHPRDLVGRVRSSVAAHADGAEQSDDITILALEVGVPPEEKAQITVPAVIDALGQVNEFIHAELDRRLCPVRVQNQLDIAVEELFVNSCKFAYEGMGEDVERYVRVTYSYSANPASITVELIDEGVPFDPLAKPDAQMANTYGDIDKVPMSGLGILMAKKNVDEMRYDRVGDLNVVTLVKRW